jgi:hypothetical protein
MTTIADRRLYPPRFLPQIPHRNGMLFLAVFSHIAAIALQFARLYVVRRELGQDVAA